MKRILYDFGGNAPCVVLCDNDRDEIKNALKSKNVAAFAKEIGINRTRIYGLLDSHRMELLRFAQICKSLNLQLLSEADVNEFTSSLNARLM